MDISTLIFDLDGTISDPSLGVYRCTNHALRTHGYPEVSLSAVVRELGPPLDETLKLFVPDVDDETIRDLVYTYRERYATTGYAENKIYPGIEELFAVLQQRDVRTGVCTSKKTEFAEKVIEMFGLGSCCRFIDGGDIGIRKEQQLAGLLGSGAIDTSAVMIGDRAVDIEAAHANGLRAIGVLWGFGSREELEQAEPELIVSEPDELLLLPGF